VSYEATTNTAPLKSALLNALILFI